jgi:hypothetical protein
MKALLDHLYAEHGITRLIEGGLTNNVPIIPAYDEVLRGRLGRRGAFVSRSIASRRGRATTSSWHSSRWRGPT